MKLDTLFSKAIKPQATNIKTKVACITPAFALACLKDFNNSNRPMSQGVAKLYANEMLRGQWKCNGEPIIFSIDDNDMEHLISGQHRLQGLVLAQHLGTTRSHVVRHGPRLLLVLHVWYG